MSLAFDPPLGTPTDRAGRPITTEETFEALSNQRRRHVVRLLSRFGGEIQLGELARRVAALENDKPADAVTAAERRRVYNALQQFHLPKLDETGAVEYDSMRGTVTPSPRIDHLHERLVAPDRYRRRCRYALGVAATAIGLFAAVTVGVTPVALLPVVALAGAATLLLAATSVDGERADSESRTLRDGPEKPH